MIQSIKNISIVFLFYHTYFNPFLIFMSSILFLFSLITKIEICYLFFNPILNIQILSIQRNQWSILSLFYPTKP